MSKSKPRSLFTKKRLFTVIIPIGIIVLFFSIFAFTNYSKADTQLTNRLSGKILLQTESHGEAWYLDPVTNSRLFLNRPADAYSIMRNLGLGIKAQELNSYLDSSFPKRLAGKILLSVEEYGEAYYINPDDLQGYYLGTPEAAFTVMREQSLGISNEDLDKITIYNNNQEEQVNIEETELSIKTITPEPVFSFSNIMTVSATLGKDINNIDNIKEWGMVWDYNNIPEAEIIPTLDDNYRRLSGDINQIKNKEEKLSLNIGGLLPSTYPYIRSYLILENDSVIYGETKAIYRYTNQRGLISGNDNTSNITPGTPSLPHVSTPIYQVYQVTYQSGAHGSLTGETIQSITSGGDTTAVTAIPDPGYSFSSWSDGVTDNPRTDKNLKSSLNVIANFSANEYTITFDSAGGTAVDPITQDYNTAVTTPVDPVKTGYTFNGWSPALPTNMPSSNETYTAQWTANTYTVTYDGNGFDSGSTADSSHTYGVEQTLTPNGYTKTGYIFNGWNTVANGTGGAYTDAQSVTNLTMNDGVTVTLYAQWEIDCGDDVTFTYNSSSVTYGVVGNPNTGECWLDRNLGATQVATALDDSASYGDLYQWGRLEDGHQLRTSDTHLGTSSTDDPGHGDFIILSSGYDWRDPKNDSLWQGEPGINNPCPVGFRIPTAAEWNTEISSWTSIDSAYNSPLKLTLAGDRSYFPGNVGHEGAEGNYWSSSVDTTYVSRLYFSSSLGFGVNSVYRAMGYSVRCIRD
jgi:uncharacterized repeat protein (TIGR02543 family)